MLIRLDSSFCPHQILPGDVHKVSPESRDTADSGSKRLLRHTVEELQKFGMTKTPSPPWVLTHRVLIPINPSCSDAAGYLIQALGGPENAFKLCGGTKWWTVRFQAGVEGEWIGIKKDWKQEEARVKKEEERQKKHKVEQGKDKVKDALPARGKNKPDREDDGVEGECGFQVAAILVTPPLMVLGDSHA